MQLFYAPDLTLNDTQFLFDKEESRHIVKVLRRNVGDELTLTNGKGYFFEATIESSNPKKCSVKISRTHQQDPPAYKLHLAVAPTKLNDRYEWFLEKATEIGVTEITPIICDHSERKVIKADRYEKIIISAMKQSLKAYKPILNEAISFQDFLASEKDTNAKYIAHCEETNKLLLKETLKAKQETLIMIGPEGDFSTTEIDEAKTNGFIPVSLGNTRLRTETAAIAACHSVAFVNQ